MKFRILFDNYYFYILIFGILSILKLFLFNEKISYGLFFIFGLLWISDLIFSKKMYLVDYREIDENIELTYLNIFLKEKKYTKENKDILSVNYLKSKSILNKYDVLEIIEKENSQVLNFKIAKKSIGEFVQEKYS